MNIAATFYVVIEMAATVISPDARPRTIGPMEQSECRAVALAIEAAAVPAIASIECREARVWTLCPVPGFPAGSVGGPCPVWSDGPFAGRPPDRK